MLANLLKVFFPLAFLIKDSRALEARCFKIDKIILKDNNLLSPLKKKILLKNYKGKCLTLESIEKLAREIGNKYINEGYITTKVDLPEQNLNSKILELEVFEGYVENIEYEDKSNRVFDTAFIGMKGNVLNLRDIEQGFDRLGNLRSNNVHIELKPGLKERSSIITVTNLAKKRLSITTGLDNSGDKDRGLYQAIITGGIDNLFGLNDALVITHKSALKDLEKPNARNVALGFVVAFGYTNFAYNYEFSRYKYSLTAKEEPLFYEGGTNKNGFIFERVVHRDASGKLALKFGVRNEIVLSTSRNSSPRVTKAIGNLQLFVGYDLGILRRNDDSELKKGKISSVVLGVKNTEGALAFNVSIAKILPKSYQNQRSKLKE